MYRRQRRRVLLHSREGTRRRALGRARQVRERSRRHRSTDPSPHKARAPVRRPRKRRRSRRLRRTARRARRTGLLVRFEVPSPPAGELVLATLDTSLGARRRDRDREAAHPALRASRLGTTLARANPGCHAHDGVADLNTRSRALAPARSAPVFVCRGAPQSGAAQGPRSPLRHRRASDEILLRPAPTAAPPRPLPRDPHARVVGRRVWRGAEDR